MPITKCHLSSLGLACILACTIPVVAQDLQGVQDIGKLVEAIQSQVQAELGDVQAEIETDIEIAQEDFDLSNNNYKIGVDCRPAPAALKSHLRLDDDMGLMVHTVMPGSPSALAGLAKYDVIVEANGHKVGRVPDLVKHVNDAQENEMTLNIIREGEEHSLKVTPEKRNADELARMQRGLRQRIGPQMFRGLRDMNVDEDLNEVFKNFPDLGRMGFQVRPAIPMPKMPNLPNSFSLRIERNNDNIIVHHGKDRYEVTTDTIDELPDEVRPMVENMMNGGGSGFFGIQGLPGPGVVPRPALPQPPQQNQRHLEERFDGFELQLKELKDAIRSIKDE